MRRSLIAILLAVSITAPACGKSSKTKTTASTSGSLGLAALLPDTIRTAGIVRVGSDISYAPIEFPDEKTQQPVGVDIDLGEAIGTKLGVRFQFTNAKFDDLIASVTQSKRFDVIMSSMTDNKDRQGKGLTFVDYFNAGTAILVKKGNPQKIHSLDDLCGKTVGLQSGTTQETLAKTQNDKCKAAKKAGINLLTFATDTDALQQLKVGRSVADMNDFPVAAYNAKISGGGSDFEVVGQQLEPGPYGIAVASSETKLITAIQSALRAIIADGTYDRILAKWNVADGALKTAAINGGS